MNLLRCLAQPTRIFRHQGWDIEKQRSIADFLVYILSGEELKHSETGRPIINDFTDVSISHKPHYIVVATIQSPYKIGIDIEYLLTDIQTVFFIGPVIKKNEQFVLDCFCRENNLSYSSGVIAFWSLKESFFKCLDTDLKPAQIFVSRIYNEKVFFSFSNSIKECMKERKIQFEYATIEIRGEYVLTQTIMCEMKKYE